MEIDLSITLLSNTRATVRILFLFPFAAIFFAADGGSNIKPLSNLQSALFQPWLPRFHVRAFHSTARVALVIIR
jgi:hypothetical protein